MRKTGYDSQQICLNGHQIFTSCHNSPAQRREFCDKCGAKTIYKCDACGKEIRGRYFYSNGTSNFGSVAVPNNCEGCGTKFPWTSANQKLAQNAALNSESTKEDKVELVKQICRKFPLFARQIQNRYADRNTIEFNDEYDVQDALHAILKLHFKDVRAEEYTPSYAGGSSRVDFLLHDEEIAIEIKKTRQGLKDKEIGEQLIVDKERYKSHPKCKTLICFVYDPEHRIGNPPAIEKDLTNKDAEIEVLTIVSPNDH